MKILFVLPEYVEDAGGGIITFYRHLVPLLAAQGHTVRVIVGSGLATAGSADRHDVDGVSVERLEHARYLAYHRRFAHFASVPTLRQLVAGAWAAWDQAAGGEGFDVVETVDWGLMFLPWAVEATVPTVVQLHGSSGQIAQHDPMPGHEVDAALTQLIERTGLARNVHLRAYSAGNAAAWRVQGLEAIDRQHPGWTPHGWGTPKPIHARTDRGVVLGRVQKWKGPLTLCEAMRTLGAEAPQVDWIGRDTAFGAPGRTMRQHLAEHCPDIWSRIVHPHPQVDAKEALQRLASAMFAVVPSEWDTFNFTCVEAMGVGTPVICSTGAGASDLIEDGRNGFVFEAGDAAALADAVRRLVSLPPQQREALALAGRETVRTPLDPAANASRRVADYARVIGSPHGQPLAAGDWLADVARPRTPAANPLAFLHHLPLRGLTHHVIRRAMRKMGRRA